MKHIPPFLVILLALGLTCCGNKQSGVAETSVPDYALAELEDSTWHKHDLWDNRVHIMMPNDYLIMPQWNNNQELFLRVDERVAMVMELLPVSDVSTKYNTCDVAKVYYDLDTLDLAWEQKKKWYEVWHDSYRALYMKENLAVHVYTNHFVVGGEPYFLICRMFEQVDENLLPVFERMTNSITLAQSRYDRFLQAFSNSVFNYLFLILFMALGAFLSPSRTRFVDHLILALLISILAIPLWMMMLWPLGWDIIGLFDLTTFVLVFVGHKTRQFFY